MNLKKIADGLRLIADGLDEGAAAKKPAAKLERSKAEKPKAEKPKAEVPSREDVIQVLQKVAKKHGRSRIDTLLNGFNVTKVSDVEESDRADLIENANAALEEE